MRIRPETPADAGSISGVIERAFDVARFSSHTEQFIVESLRKTGDLSVSLVAEREQTIVGYVAFSQVAISDGSENWYGLGPIAVEPSLQGQGIGSALVEAGLAQLQTIGAAGCVVLGDPAYYHRFGFQSVSGLRYPGLPPEYFMARCFASDIPVGVVTYHAAFASES
ncbi:MAG: N-acetyltransferase [Methylococcaceae bacterium]|nr:N-acetyltransferase [Methylococcaceae bacterium]